LGLARFRWEAAPEIGLPSAGQVDTVSFDAAHWKPDYPNPAFDERTARDVRWGARIVAAFDDDLIRAAIRSAGYSDPRAAEYLTRVLVARRDRIARTWRVAPGPAAGPR